MQEHKNSPIVNFLFYCRIIYNDRKSNFSGKFQRFSDIDEIIEMLKNS